MHTPPKKMVEEHRAVGILYHLFRHNHVLEVLKAKTKSLVRPGICVGFEVKLRRVEVDSAVSQGRGRVTRGRGRLALAGVDLAVNRHGLKRK